MKISGFSYIRNGFTYGYPFLESIRSILPICDEFVIAVGASSDGTREAIVALNSDKIRIIDTVWDEQLREGGKIFAQQANIALDAITGDWGFHIQADEVVHEDDLETIRKAVLRYDNDPRVEGLLLKFLNFYGSFDYIGVTRKWHRREVRLIRNKPEIRSYRDSQGFRKYPGREAWEQGHPGTSLRVKLLDAHIYHYSYARNPKLMKKKADYFHSFWHDDQWLEKNLEKQPEFDYSEVDGLVPFSGSHPAIMKPCIAQQDWSFTYEPGRAKSTLKLKVLNWIEKKTGWRIGEYRNYRII
jgi:glycosyltransferase involved in cell wall biosynthesis